MIRRMAELRSRALFEGAARGPVPLAARRVGKPDLDLNVRFERGVPGAIARIKRRRGRKFSW